MIIYSNAEYYCYSIKRNKYWGSKAEYYCDGIKSSKYWASNDSTNTSTSHRRKATDVDKLKIPVNLYSSNTILLTKINGTLSDPRSEI